MAGTKGKAQTSRARVHAQTALARTTAQRTAGARITVNGTSVISGTTYEQRA
jgi:hypothetical protein